MANIKVSEMTEATAFDDGDYTMIVQANQNKKISKENILGDIEDDISTINNNIGNLSNLETVDISNLVNSINSLTPKILWTNPNSTSNFSAQTITLSSSDYDMYEILFITNLNDVEKRVNTSGRIIKGYGTRLGYVFAGSTNPGANLASRWVDYVSNTELAFATGYLAYGTTARIENNGFIVPIYIIGYKTGLFNNEGE